MRNKKDMVPRSLRRAMSFLRRMVPDGPSLGGLRLIIRYKIACFQDQHFERNPPQKGRERGTRSLRRALSLPFEDRIPRGLRHRN